MKINVSNYVYICSLAYYVYLDLYSIRHRLCNYRLCNYNAKNNTRIEHWKIVKEILKYLSHDYT